MKKQKMPVIGYHVSLNFNGTYMWPYGSKLDKCPCCGYKLDFITGSPEYAFRKSFKPKVVGVGGSVAISTPLSSTYDCYNIATEEFKEYCEAQCYKDLEFVALRNDPKHFQLICHTVINVDAETSRLRFGKLCPICENYDSTVFGSPSLCYVNTEQLIPDGIFRSNLLFASGDIKHPLIIIGPETMAKFKEAGFKKMGYRDIYQSPQAEE